MVYGGPSRGCHLCRQRRIKCDKRQDGCANCARVKQSCPGYRDQTDLLFRSENKSAAKRSANAQAKRMALQGVANLGQKSPPDEEESPVEPVVAGTVTKASYTPGSRSQPKNLAVTSLSSPLLSPSNLRSASLVEQALASFFTYFAVDFPGQSVDLTSRVNDTLLSAIIPIGLVGASRVTADPRLMVTAHQKYVDAISTTNLALCSSAAAEDSTLMAVMLLGLFETITGCTTRSMDSWRDHINGAAAILKFRGTEKSKTYDGVRLSAYAATHLAADCLRCTVPVPDHVLETIAELGRQIDGKDPGWRLCEANILTTNFLVSVQRGVLCDPEAIISRAIELDALYTSVFSEADPEWAYEVVHVKDSNDPWLDNFHVYASYVSAQVWTGMRIMRFVLHELLCSILARMPATLASCHPELAFQAGLSASILSTLQGEILASVPQHLGHASSPSNLLPSDSSSDNGSEYSSPTMDSRLVWSNFPRRIYDPSRGAFLSPPRLPHLQAFGFCTLPWGLYLVGKSINATPPVRIYAVKLLEQMGSHLGILQAVCLAEELQACGDVPCQTQKD